MQSNGRERLQAGICLCTNLKGVCLNLSLGPLATEASELCELLRGGTPKEGAEELFAKVQKSYEKAAAYIGKL